ncbi:MAG: hypothetical protein ACYTF1_02475 [Planctomycetota bacterium]
MKKLFVIFGIVTLVFAFSAASTFAGKGSGAGNGDCQQIRDGSCDKTCPNYQDENGDGVCDNCPDDDGDGIPNCQDDDYAPPRDGTGKKNGKCQGRQNGCRR